MRQEPASINYIYAMFLTGSVLSALNQSSVLSSADVDQATDKAVNEMFQDYSKTDFLEKIRKLTSRFAKKCFYERNGLYPIYRANHCTFRTIEREAVDYDRVPYLRLCLGQ
ncbi:MAG: hypothetical protein JNJ47_07035 [Alphaproteobacteria bacterium]|nr:hypothetical protein [Alphaproteobacteria bacterium]